MNGIFEICGVAIVGGIAVLMLSEIGGRLSFAVKIGTVVIITLFVVTSSKEILSELYSLVGESGEIANYYEIIIRTLGIAIIAHISAGICRDCGAESVANTVECAARVEIFVLCFPLIRDILATATQMLELHQR